MQTEKKLIEAYSQVFISSKIYNSKRIYAKRRKILMKKLDSFCVFAGVQIEPGCEEPYIQIWTKMIQDPAFIYLTGINQTGCYLVLDPLDNKEVLFLPKKDSFKEFWNGKRLGYIKNDKEASFITGIKDIRPTKELWTFIDSISKKYLNNSIDFAYTYYFDKIKNCHNAKFKNQFSKKLGKFKMKVKSSSSMHFDNRLVLEKERILDAKKAQSITNNAFRALLKRAKLFKNEREISSFLNYEMFLHGDSDLAFPTIVASASNACCLHYVKNDENIPKKSLVLLDFGIRYGTLHSDISRTIPISGKFNPLQKLLYQIVLDSSFEYQKYVKPGVSLKEIGQIPWDYILQELETRLVKNFKGTYKLIYEKRPHGVSHFIGEQIHEGNPSSRSLDVILKKGMLISCEPGLYGTFSAKINGVFYKETLGIRIEDDLLITDKGFINISKNIPKSVEDIERFME